MSAHNKTLISDTAIGYEQKKGHIGLHLTLMYAPMPTHFSQSCIDSGPINSKVRIGVRLQSPGIGKKSGNSYHDYGHKVWP